MRLGMARGADPVWSGFSDVHADWHYEDITDSSATMDVSSHWSPDVAAFDLTCSN